MGSLKLVMGKKLKRILKFSEDFGKFNIQELLEIAEKTLMGRKMALLSDLEACIIVIQDVECLLDLFAEIINEDLKQTLNSVLERAALIYTAIKTEFL